LTAAQRAAIESAAAGAEEMPAMSAGSHRQRVGIAAFAVAALILIAVAMPSLWRSPRSADPNHSVIAENAKVPDSVKTQPPSPAASTSSAKPNEPVRAARSDAAGDQARTENPARKKRSWRQWQLRLR
jgi:hypothetical protein